MHERLHAVPLGPEALVLFICLLFVSACDAKGGSFFVPLRDEGGEPEPATGDLVVRTETTGEAIDEDGYTVEVEGAGQRPIGINDEETFEDLEVGERSVELSGVADNCAIQGDNPRNVAVPGETTFEIVCEAPGGDLTVNTETTGEALDEDGYTVGVEGAGQRPIGVNDQVTFEDLEVGEYGVELTGVADNCAVEGENPRDVAAPGETTFEIVCEAPRGDLTVRTETSGEAIDPDGYTLKVEGEDPRMIGVNDEETYENLAVGQRSVELAGIAANCEVQDGNPRDVAVPGETTFEVVCDR